MKLPKKVKPEYLGIGALILVLLLAGFYLKLIPLSITETSCYGTQIWVKVVSDNLAGQIPDCTTNPQGGFRGAINYFVISPTGNEYPLGGYEASETSIQKISCGWQYQQGKGFAGKKIPNDGAGTYRAIVRGYYLNGQERVNFEYEFGSKPILSCTRPDATCSDGTPLNSCSSSKPYKCQDYFGQVQLVPQSECGCQAGYVFQGGNCQPIPAPPVCQTGDTHYFTCPDGTQVIKDKCTDGQYVPREYACPETTTTDTGTTPQPTTDAPEGTTALPSATGSCMTLTTAQSLCGAGEAVYALGTENGCMTYGCAPIKLSETDKLINQINELLADERVLYIGGALLGVIVMIVAYTVVMGGKPKKRNG